MACKSRVDFYLYNSGIFQGQASVRRRAAGLLHWHVSARANQAQARGHCVFMDGWGHVLDFVHHAIPLGGPLSR